MAPKRKVRAKDPVLEAFGRNLQHGRKLLALTQEDVAKLLKLSVAYISLLERGQRNPPLTLVMSLAKAIHVSPAWLVDPDSIAARNGRGS